VARPVLDIAAGSSSSNRDELRVTDLLDAEELAERHEAPGYRSVDGHWDRARPYAPRRHRGGERPRDRHARTGGPKVEDRPRTDQPPDHRTDQPSGGGHQ
jgi:GrpB-like predicted nucleotidyltransferase (UPF0157 family)